jgi:hypothetical protein
LRVSIRPPSPGKTAEKVRLLVEAGVESIVDLTTPEDHLDSYQEALNVARSRCCRSRGRPRRVSSRSVMVSVWAVVRAHVTSGRR